MFGSLADRWGRRTTYLLGAVLMLVSIIPGFALINTGDAFAFGAALVLILGIAMAPAGGVTGSLFSMIFTPEGGGPHRSARPVSTSPGGYRQDAAGHPVGLGSQAESPSSDRPPDRIVMWFEIACTAGGARHGGHPPRPRRAA